MGEIEVIEHRKVRFSASIVKSKSDTSENNNYLTANLFKFNFNPPLSEREEEFVRGIFLVMPFIKDQESLKIAFEKSKELDMD